MSICAQAWAGPGHAAQRQLYSHVKDRSLRAWHVALRLSAAPVDSLLPLLKLLQLHYEAMQSTPPQCSALQRVARDAAFLEHAAAAEGLAMRMMEHPELAGLQGQAQTGPWRVPFLLGKVRCLLCCDFFFQQQKQTPRLSSFA